MNISGSAVFLDQSKQNVQIHRLIDGTICSNPFLRIRKGAESHNRDVGMGTISLQCINKLPTVHHWHHEVEEDQTWSNHLRKDLHALLSVRSRVNAVSFPFERVLENRANIHLVFDEQNAFGNVFP